MSDALDVNILATRVEAHDEAIEALKHSRDQLEADGRDTRRLINEMATKMDQANVAFTTRLDTLSHTWQERLDAFRSDQQADNELTRDKLDAIRMDQAKALERSANVVPSPVAWLLRILLTSVGILGGVILTHVKW